MWYQMVGLEARAATAGPAGIGQHHPSAPRYPRRKPRVSRCPGPPPDMRKAASRQISAAGRSPFVQGKPELYSGPAAPRQISCGATILIAVRIPANITMQTAQVARFIHCVGWPHRSIGVILDSQASVAACHESGPGRAVSALRASCRFLIPALLRGLLALPGPPLDGGDGARVPQPPKRPRLEGL